jgi:DNA-binding CsgD family transcriptional regulator
MLSSALPTPQLREQFLCHSLAQLPAPPTLTPLRARKQSVDGLTARESEIAALIQQGKSDREIAEALSLSKRTVSTHVSNILAKLDFSSRAQIAAWAVAKGL